jgi:hypothetical protein
MVSLTVSENSQNIQRYALPGIIGTLFPVEMPLRAELHVHAILLSESVAVHLIRYRLDYIGDGELTFVNLRCLCSLEPRLSEEDRDALECRVKT